MAATLFHILNDRAVLSVDGADAEKFLGDLVTGDVVGLDPLRAGYAGLLTPQGKVLFDFLVFRDEDRFLLDTPADAIAKLAQRLSLYKLRAKVDVDPLPEARVVAAWGGKVADVPGLVADPRLSALGSRGVLMPGDEVDPALASPADADAYHARRIGLGVPEAGADFAYGDVFPHDIAMDQLGGVDFQKGCYVGQEVVSRMQHRGTARRRIVTVRSDGDLPTAGSDLKDGDRPVGALGSRTGDRGIAIVRLDRTADAIAHGRVISVDDIAVTPEIPPWATYDWPEAADA